MKQYSFSELQRFQECERLYEYTYDERIEPVFDGLPKPIGSALHEGLDHMYNGLGGYVEAAKVRYFRDLGDHLAGLDGPSPSDESAHGEELRKVLGGWKVVKHLLTKYPWKDVPQLLHGECVIEVEMGHGRSLVTRVDRLMRTNNSLWVHDTKSSGFQPAPIIKTMRLRHQFAGYVYAVGEWLRGAAVQGPPVPRGLQDKVPDGVILDMLFKPRVTWHRKAKAYTGEVSVKGESYHREPLHISNHDVFDFTEWFHTVVGRIEANTHPRPKNTNACFSYNRVCGFFEFCRTGRVAQLREGPGFKVREFKHPQYSDVVEVE